MERLVRGDVVVLLFPFSDLSSSRKRPAVVVANLTGDDLILAQITTASARSDEYAVSLEAKDFQKGNLAISSLVRPNKLFTADISIISSKIGTLREDKIKEIQNSLVNMFN
ncbi:MAG TPA: type II toxin-antitoxin system PemK/MazF family toxin [Candidatus Nanoarchaeia archaeon]|nr:type II toxin-antitoxin system PemK/MazF family toxin [Candidatus Nanoarchaeia archaeon]